MKSILTLFTCLVVAATASARELDVSTADVKKEEVRHSQIGPRDTLIFYTFADQAAVLELNVKHDAGKFTLSGKVRLFAEGTTAEDIGKWINNQHSCGLFPEVPKPVASVELPADACAVIESKRKEGELQEGPTGDRFEDHSLRIRVADFKSGQDFRLKGFTADTSAFVKVGPAA